MATETENEFLASMLAWERAPILQVCKWFNPELKLPFPDTLDELELHQLLHHTIEQLYSKSIVLEFTEHLSDRDLYCLILRDILPSFEKQIESSSAHLQWQCIDPVRDESIWLTFYASDDERTAFQNETGRELPAREAAPYPRQLPQHR